MENKHIHKDGASLSLETFVGWSIRVILGEAKHVDWAFRSWTCILSWADRSALLNLGDQKGTQGTMVIVGVYADDLVITTSQVTGASGFWIQEANEVQIYYDLLRATKLLSRQKWSKAEMRSHRANQDMLLEFLSRWEPLTVIQHMPPWKLGWNSVNQAN
jgi:hypothetical protein